VRASPVLSVGYVGALMVHGEPEGAEEHLQDAERWLSGAEASGAASDPRLRTLPGTIAMYRAGVARLKGDVDGTITHARRALQLAAEPDHLERGAAAALLGLAHWTKGDVDVAAGHYAESVDQMRHAGHLPDLLGCTIALADIALARGRLSDALAAYRRGLAAAEREPAVPRGTADMHVGLATLLLERDEVDDAVEHLRTSAALGEHAALGQNPYRSRLAMAQVRSRRGDLEGALELLDEAERVYDTDYSPDVRPIAAVRARAWLAHGRTADAARWARSRGLSADDEVSYLREYEHLTLARLLLQEPDTRLDRLLLRLLTAAQDSGRAGSVIEVLVLQALTAQAQGDPVSAADPLRRALALAEPHGYVRVFTEHGAQVTALLKALTKEPGESAYPRQLLAAAQGQAPERRPERDPLSEREAEVLRLLASDLDGPQIARALVVSVNTVRTHTKSIYAKLGVNSRRAAVHRAQDLGLLAPGPRA
jgi:LuxR family transcriptional regulator, maltose regulon positive regulatory protein